MLSQAIWADREKTRVFSGKFPQDYWVEVFETRFGKDETKVLCKGINLNEMIKAT